MPAAVLLLVFLATPAQADEPAERVWLRGKEYVLCPTAWLRAKGLPARDLPADQNAASLYIEAANAATPPSSAIDTLTATLAGGEPLADDDLRRLSQHLDANRAALDLAVRASRMADCSLPVFRGETDQFWATLMPVPGEVRSLSRLLAARAELAARGGDHGAALDDCAAVMRIGNHCGADGPLINSLVGVACFELGTQTAFRIVRQHEIPADVLARSAEAFNAAAAARPSLEAALEYEAAVTQVMVAEALDLSVVGYGVANLTPGPGPAADASPAWRRLASRLRRLYFPDREVRRHLGEYHDTLRSAARRPATELRAAEQQAMHRVPAWDTVTRSVATPLVNAHEAHRRAVANADRVRLAVAVSRFHREHGHWPPTVEALVPAYLTSVPTDPSDRGPLELPAAAPGESPLQALELVRRPSPAGAGPSAVRSESAWADLVRAFAVRHRLSPAQRAAAAAILRDVEHRAAGLTGPASEASDALAVLDRELRERLDDLLTAEQRAAVAPPQPSSEAAP